MNIPGTKAAIPTFMVMLIGVPVAIVLGGTRIGPIINLSLIAIEVAILLRPSPNPAATA